MSRGMLPSSLALSEDLAFEAVLTDIPLFSVGLMAMGVVTFIFIMKRVNPVVLYLCTASLLLFVAAILDLGRLLIQGPSKASQNVGLNTVSGFLIAREIGLALSDGFLLLFLWKAVALCPVSERCRSIRRLSETSTSSNDHSASWTRWGVVGMVLKWLTLTLSIVTPLLQIIWRIIDDQRRYGSVYIAESTLEIVASAIFILKVLLNVSVSPSPSWWIPFKSYLGLLLALVISTAIGLGNLVAFSFSETVLGRFLRAISIYVLLLYNLISIFYIPGVTREPNDDVEAARANIEQEKPKKLVIDTTDSQLLASQRSPSIMVVDRTLPTPVEKHRPPIRVSTSSRLSNWVNRTISPVLDQNEGLAMVTRSLSSISPRKSPIVVAPAKRPRKPELHFDIIIPALPSKAEQVDSSEDLSATDGDVSAGQALPVIEHPSGSVMPAGTSPSATQPPSLSKGSLTSFDELLQQQNELDKSIANLKLLSLDTTLATTVKHSSIAGETLASTKSRPQSTLKSESPSQRSEFSLSVFPEPPTRPESLIAETPSRYTRPFTLRRKAARLSFSELSQIPFASIPGSPSQNGTNARLMSAGTQYDVTSFIGDLTEPGNQSATSTTPVTFPSSGLRSAPINELDFRSGDERPSDTVSDDASMSNLRPMLLPSVAKERKVFPPVTLIPISRIGVQPSSPSVWRRDSSAALKPFLLGTAGNSVPVSLPSNTMVPLGPRRASRAARVAAHKSQISVPMLRNSDALGSDASKAYERPRTPPLLLEPFDRPKS